MRGPDAPWQIRWSPLSPSPTTKVGARALGRRGCGGCLPALAWAAAHARAGGQPGRVLRAQRPSGSRWFACGAWKALWPLLVSLDCRAALEASPRPARLSRLPRAVHSDARSFVRPSIACIAARSGTAGSESWSPRRLMVETAPLRACRSTLTILMPRRRCRSRRLITWRQSRSHASDASWTAARREGTHARSGVPTQTPTRPRSARAQHDSLQEHLWSRTAQTVLR